MSIVKIVTNIPKRTDEELVQQFRNVLFVESRYDEAATVLRAISNEWKARSATAESRPSRSWPENGLLAVLGYHVGFDKGRSQRERRLLLDYILRGQLPFVHSRHYMLQWAEPGSKQRQRKLQNCIQAFIENCTNPKNSMKAMNEWSGDLDYIKHSRQEKLHLCV